MEEGTRGVRGRRREQGRKPGGTPAQGSEKGGIQHTLWGQLYAQKVMRPFLISYIRINSKWIKDLNAKKKKPLQKA